MTDQTTYRNTQDNALTHYFSIPMHYTPGAHNGITGNRRRETTVKYTARCGVTSPTFIAWLYDIRYPLALEHLNKLVKEKLLSMIPTHRSLDGRAYILAYDGAKYAEELLSMSVYFRSSSNPARSLNQNSLMHDLINQFALAWGIQHQSKQGLHKPLWNGFITEREFRRLYPASNIRNVDGLVLEPDGTKVAVEIENSFKNVSARRDILYRYVKALNENIYQKVFICSQSRRIINDIKRINEQIIQTPNKKQSFSAAEEKLITEKIIYRTALCEPIETLFYK